MEGREEDMVWGFGATGLEAVGISGFGAKGLNKL